MKKSQKTKKAAEEPRQPDLDEIETTLAEMIETIEKYFLVAPFQFIEGHEEQTPYYCFPKPKTESPFSKFYEWADHWMCKLFPEAYEAQYKLQETGNDADEVGELAFAAQRFGYVVGFLVGCKTMGASQEELTDKCQGFTIPVIYQADKRRKEASRE